MEIDTSVVNQVDPGSDNGRKKKVYSKGGCRECKRRKIKCSEEKPQCWQCRRLNKQCSYPELGERVPRVSRKLLQQNPNAMTESHQQTPLMIQQFSPNGNVNMNLRHAGKNYILTPTGDRYSSSPSGTPITVNNSDSSESISHLPRQGKTLPVRAPHINQLPTKYATNSIGSLLNDATTVPLGGMPNEKPTNLISGGTTALQMHSYQPHDSNKFSDLSPSTVISTPNPSHIDHSMLLMNNDSQFYNRSDLNILASDLNNLVSNIMFESNFDNILHENFNFNSNYQGEFENLEILNPKEFVDYENPIAEEVVLRNIPLDYIPLSNSRDKAYLSEFYNDFSEMILPFRAYDPNLGQYFNPARDILLQRAANEPFLLAAILSQGARIAYHKNHFPSEEEAYVTYLSKCLKLLGPAISADFTKVRKSSLTYNIEAVLLTVLLLTSANATNIRQDWRPHLRGAKDLLMRNATSKLHNTKVLIFCRCWFINFEILASLSSQIGGTLKRDEELNLLINPGSEYEIKVLKEIGMVKENGFNLLGGFHNSCISPMRELIKALNKLRRRDVKSESDDPFNCLKILLDLYEQTQTQFVSKNYILSDEEYDEKALGGYLIDVIQVKNSHVIMNWMDCSHKAYTMACIITALTRIYQVPPMAHQIQWMVKEIVSMISFVEDLGEPPQQTFKCSMMMLQWPTLTAALNAVNSKDRSIFVKFFKLSLVIGSASASLALERIQYVWDQMDKGVINTEEDNVDIVFY